MNIYSTRTNQSYFILTNSQFIETSTILPCFNIKKLTLHQVKIMRYQRMQNEDYVKDYEQRIIKVHVLLQIVDTSPLTLTEHDIDTERGHVSADSVSSDDAVSSAESAMSLLEWIISVSTINMNT